MKLIVAMSLMMAPIAALGQSVDDTQASRLGAAVGSIRAGQPQAAFDTLEGVLKAYEAAYAHEKRRIYCGMSGAETLAYMALAASAKTDAVAVAPGFCEALFLKGYVLIDLNRLAEARAVYSRLLTLAPMHSHYLAELGQSYRPERNWPKMLEICTSAANYAELSNPDEVKEAKGMAWRCMGYALIEQNKYDEAAALYRKCLDLDPNDASAQNELKYIEDQRRKTE